MNWRFLTTCSCHVRNKSRTNWQSGDVSACDKAENIKAIITVITASNNGEQPLRCQRDSDKWDGANLLPFTNKPHSQFAKIKQCTLIILALKMSSSEIFIFSYGCHFYNNRPLIPKIMNILSQDPKIMKHCVPEIMKHNQFVFGDNQADDDRSNCFAFFSNLTHHLSSQIILPGKTNIESMKYLHELDPFSI